MYNGAKLELCSKLKFHINGSVSNSYIMLKELRNNVLCFIFCGHVSLHSLPIILGNLEIKRD